MGRGKSSPTIDYTYTNTDFYIVQILLLIFRPFQDYRRHVGRQSE